MFEAAQALILSKNESLKSASPQKSLSQEGTRKDKIAKEKEDAKKEDARKEANEKKNMRLGVFRGNSKSPDFSGFIPLSKTPRIYRVSSEHYYDDNYGKELGMVFNPPSIKSDEIDSDGNVAVGLKKRSKTRKHQKKHKTQKRHKKSKKGFNKSKTYKRKYH